jgi:hypothetical protein
VASPQDILHTLHDGMANKVVSLLERSQRRLRRVLVIGGVSRNAAMLAALREKLASAEVVSPTIFGEVIPTVGRGLAAQHEGYDGVILVGPFNCLPFRISEAILQPVSIQRGMPILAYESDGYAVPPSFLRQVEVHIQQVLQHAAAHPRTPRTAREILSGLFASPPA